MELFLPVTMASAAAAALINVWLSTRIAALRLLTRNFTGDGGDEAMIRRMRAHLNFAENTPLVLILLALVEAAGMTGVWLPWIAGIYVVARIGHGIGMDGGTLWWLRTIGTGITWITQLYLAGLSAGALVAYLGS